MALDLNSIHGITAEASDYEFIVVVQRSDGLYYMGAFEHRHEAEELALSFKTGLIIHNVRIQGKREKPKKKYYTFSGLWSWGCWAENLDDAKRQFDEASFEDVDVDFDHVEIEVDDD